VADSVGVEPYYQDESCTIYHGDCREVWSDRLADVVVTDPPYGVGFQYASFTDDESAWTDVKATLSALTEAYPAAICMSFARLWEMPPARWAAAWFKPGSVRRSRIGGWATWEPVLLYGDGWRIANDMLRLPDCANHTPEAAGHPCPKPVDLFRWLVEGAPAGVILDPYMGSGTTLRAAKDTGREAIGIEIEERYCEIAAKRLAQEVLAI
jgi:site-specific DNA-methyltransferase (adenine-specific)